LIAGPPVGYPKRTNGSPRRVGDRCYRRRSWSHEQGSGGQPNLLCARVFTEEVIVVQPDLEAQARAVAIACHAVVGSGVADETDHLTAVHALADAQPAGESGKVAVTQDGAV